MQAFVVTIPGCVHKRMLPPIAGGKSSAQHLGFTATKTLRYLGPANRRTAICVVQKHDPKPQPWPHLQQNQRLPRRCELCAACCRRTVGTCLTCCCSGSVWSCPNHDTHQPMSPKHSTPQHPPQWIVPHEIDDSVVEKYSSWTCCCTTGRCVITLTCLCVHCSSRRLDVTARTSRRLRR